MCLTNRGMASFILEYLPKDVGSAKQPWSKEMASPPEERAGLIAVQSNESTVCPGAQAGRLTAHYKRLGFPKLRVHLF